MIQLLNLTKSKKILKNHFFFLLKKHTKKCKTCEKQIQFAYFCHLGRLVFDQSSPFKLVSESRGGPSERHRRTNGRRRTEILVSNIWLEKVAPCLLHHLSIIAQPPETHPKLRKDIVLRFSVFCSETVEYCRTKKKSYFLVFATQFPGLSLVNGHSASIIELKRRSRKASTIDSQVISVT